MSKSQTEKRRQKQIIAQHNKDVRAHAVDVRTFEGEDGEFKIQIGPLPQPEREITASWADVKPVNSSLQFMFAAVVPDISTKVPVVVVVEVARERVKSLLIEDEWAANLLALEVPNSGEREIVPDFTEAKVALFRATIINAATIELDGELRFHHPSPRATYDYIKKKSPDLLVGGVLTVYLGIDVLQGLVRKLVALT